MMTAELQEKRAAEMVSRAKNLFINLSLFCLFFRFLQRYKIVPKNGARWRCFFIFTAVQMRDEILLKKGVSECFVLMFCILCRFRA